jgi:hypothetical protein
LLFKQADLEIKVTSREYSPKIEDPRIDIVKHRKYRPGCASRPSGYKRSKGYTAAE